LTKEISGDNLPDGLCLSSKWVYEKILYLNPTDPPLVAELYPHDIIEKINVNGYVVLEIEVKFK
jgi:hypothetical protein